MHPNTITIMLNKIINIDFGATNKPKAANNIMTFKIISMFFQEYCLTSANLPINGCIMEDTSADIAIVKPIAMYGKPKLSRKYTP